MSGWACKSKNSHTNIDRCLGISVRLGAQSPKLRVFGSMPWNSLRILVGPTVGLCLRNGRFRLDQESRFAYEPRSFPRQWPEILCES